MSTTTIKRDLYCWVCHLDLPLLRCKSCPRAYHRQCAYDMSNYPDPTFHDDSSTPSVMDECPECVVSKQTALPSMQFITQPELMTILGYVTKNLKDGYFWPNPLYKLEVEGKRYPDLVAKVMDIYTLQTMVYNGDFSTLEGFLAEAKWMIHNTIIYFGRSAKETKIAEEVMRLSRIELMAADLCPECYCKEQNRDMDLKWFVKPCLIQPHVLGWAKIPNSPYWPVKLMQARGDKMTVRCFADYRRYDVPIKDCYFFSENPPRKLQVGKRKEDLKKALFEINEHIKELKKVYGYLAFPDDGLGNPLPIGSMALKDVVTRVFPHWKPSESRNVEDNNNV